MCLVVNKSTKIAIENWSHLLPDFNQKWLSLTNLQYMLTIFMQLEYHRIMLEVCWCDSSTYLLTRSWTRARLQWSQELLFSKIHRGFVDRTVKPICWTGVGQRQVYNSYKKVLSLKFLSVAVSNYVIANLYSPVESRCHDSAVLAMCALLPELRAHSNDPNGNILCIYEDPAYPLSSQLLIARGLGYRVSV